MVNLPCVTCIQIAHALGHFWQSTSPMMDHVLKKDAIVLCTEHLSETGKKYVLFNQELRKLTQIQE